MPGPADPLVEELFEVAPRDRFDSADEIFVVGNYGKVTPVTRIEGRDLQPGPFFHRARKLYWEFAHAH